MIDRLAIADLLCSDRVFCSGLDATVLTFWLHVPQNRYRDLYNYLSLETALDFNVFIRFLGELFS